MIENLFKVVSIMRLPCLYKFPKLLFKDSFVMLSSKFMANIVHIISLGLLAGTALGWCERVSNCISK